jgi:hypothetical protein
MRSFARGGFTEGGLEEQSVVTLRALAPTRHTCASDSRARTWLDQLGAVCACAGAGTPQGHLIER